MKAEYIHLTPSRMYCLLTKYMMDCPFALMNYPVYILVSHITLWGHYGRRRLPPSLCWADGIGARIHTDWLYAVPHHGPLWRERCWQSTPGNQSARHPPLCAMRDVASRVWFQLKAGCSRRTSGFDLFSFQRAQTLTLLYAWETLQPQLPRMKREKKKKKVQVLSACYGHGMSEVCGN